MSGRYLVVDGRRYRIYDALRFADGLLSARPKDELIWTRHNGDKKTLDLHAILENWLDDDAFWGGHQEANELRWMAEGKGGGISAEIAECYTFPNGSALAVLNLLSGAYSFAAPISQVLVKVRPQPFSIERVRILGGIGDGMSGEGPRRFYPAGNRLFCNDGASIDELGADGQKIAKRASWKPTTIPIGFCANRWIIGTIGSEPREDILQATDLFSGKSFELVDLFTSPLSDKYSGLQPIGDKGGATVDVEEPYVLFSPGAVPYANTYKRKYWTIHLPDGIRRELPGEYQDALIAGPYAVGMDFGDNFYQMTLFDAKSGRLLGSYKNRTSG